MSFNVGAAKKVSRYEANSVESVISELSPDIIALQEAVEWEEEGGSTYSLVDELARVNSTGRWHRSFSATLTMRAHMDTRKAVFVDSLFKDRLDWRQGNALLSKRRFVRLGDPTRPGSPKDVPLYRPAVYQGSRDTDPRHALIGRVDWPPLFPFVVGAHLATFVGEREREGGYRPQPEREEEAQIMRFRQARRMLELLREHVLAKRYPILVLGDLNGPPSEPAIRDVLIGEAGLVRLEPRKEIATHPKVRLPVDHILVGPAERLLEYECWVVDTEEARAASDHLPVVADIVME